MTAYGFHHTPAPCATIPSDDTIKALRDALRFSPENVPLHEHLADSLLAMGQFADAENAYRDGLKVAPRDAELNLGLAAAFFQQEKYSPAMIVVEEFLKQADPPFRAYLGHARLFTRGGDLQRAGHQRPQG